MPSFVSLSTVKPDPESIILQLQLALQSRDTWNSFQTSGVGEALLELMGAIGGMNQFGLESAFREAFFTANRDSSIYALCALLGVRINRKYPAGVKCAITRNVDNKPVSVVPKFTQMSINGVDFFNRVPLMFAQGSSKAAERMYYGPAKTIASDSLTFDLALFSTSIISDGDEFDIYIAAGSGAGQFKPVVYVEATGAFKLVSGSWADLNSSSQMMVLNNSVTLYQGTITSETFMSTGEAFNELTLNEPNFNISDVDVAVYVTDTSNTTSEWTLFDDGVWDAESTDKCFFDYTTGAGEARIMFGDGEHGANPVLASTITVKYAVTTGAAGNKGLAGLEVVCASDSTLSGKTISTITGGADNKAAGFYRKVGPYIRRANKRTVNPVDYTATACDFPGVVSASIMTQREIAPYDLRWMNVVQICLLPLDTNVTAMTNIEWSDFDKYMEKKKHAAIHLAHKNPTAQIATINLTLALKSSYTPAAVIPLAEKALNALFARRKETLGRRIAMSDIDDTAKVEGVDYVNIDVCRLDTMEASITKANLVPNDKTHFIKLGQLTINTMYSERDVYFGDVV